MMNSFPPYEGYIRPSLDFSIWIDTLHGDIAILTSRKDLDRYRLAMKPCPGRRFRRERVTVAYFTCFTRQPASPFHGYLMCFGIIGCLLSTNQRKEPYQSQTRACCRRLIRRLCFSVPEEQGSGVDGYN